MIVMRIYNSTYTLTNKHEVREKGTKKTQHTDSRCNEL